MNPIINYIASLISKRIESGSTKGAWAGAVIGVLLLGGSAAAGWATGATGFMGLGLTIAGALFGAIAGALIGAGRGPADRLVTAEGQTSVTVSDYNSKLAPLGVMLVSLAIGGFALHLYIKTTGEHAQMSLLMAFGGGLVALGALIYTAFQNLSVTLGDDIRIRRLFNQYRFGYEDIERCELRTTDPGGANPLREGNIIFVLELPGHVLVYPVTNLQAAELHALLKDLMYPDED
jgi:hypothetical protein